MMVGKTGYHLSLVILLILSLGLSSCESVDRCDDKIPFEYDRNYDYLSVLKCGPGYSDDPTEGIPLFCYQDPSDANLTELRITHGLDDVLGEGDELSRIFNLLRWAHQSLRHDGGRSVQPENSLAILRYHQESGNGVNCVMMAIVLNEAYLAMGFSSRVIHGNSRDWVFNGDWHAFNAVYSRNMAKWVFVDPMNQAYFTDGGGTPLSPSEIREYLKQDLPVYLNGDADYNGQPVNTDDYLHYLTKNLYRLSCPLNSAFGNNWIFHYPEEEHRTYVHLDPRGDPQDGLGRSTNYFTSHLEQFHRMGESSTLRER